MGSAGVPAPLGAAIGAGIGDLALAPTFLMLARARKTSADSFRAKADEG